MCFKKSFFQFIIFHIISSLALANIIQEDVHFLEQTDSFRSKATTQVNDGSSFNHDKYNRTNSQKSYDYDDSNLWNFVNQIFWRGVNADEKSQILFY